MIQDRRLISIEMVFLIKEVDSFSNKHETILYN